MRISRKNPADGNVETLGELRRLRHSVRAGSIDRDRFCAEAAHCYRILGKPQRAAALQALTGKKLHAAHPDGQTKKTIRCSLNMIVCNEQGRIEETLDSVDDVFDEIVVCDTGSTDETAAIARLYGAMVVSRPWDEDFSHARNHAIEHSSGEAIVWMDADDRLDPSSKAPLKEMIENPQVKAAAFCIRNGMEKAGGTKFLQVRYFPRREGIRFERCIHEQVVFSLKRECIAITTLPSIVIRHTGYTDPQQHRDKARRNKPLIEKELKWTPGDPTLLLSLGDVHAVLGEYEEAFDIYTRLAADERAGAQHPQAYVQACAMAANCAFSRRDYTAVQTYATRALTLDSTRADALYLLGRMHLARGRKDNAFACFVKSSRLQPMLRSTALDGHMVRMRSIYFTAHILLEHKRYDEAHRVLTAAMQIYPQVIEFYLLSAEVCLGQNRINDAAHTFRRVVELEGGNAAAWMGLARIYDRLGDPLRARSLLEEAISKGVSSAQLCVECARRYCSEHPQARHENPTPQQLLDRGVSIALSAGKLDIAAALRQARTWLRSAQRKKEPQTILSV